MEGKFLVLFHLDKTGTTCLVTHRLLHPAKRFNSRKGEYKPKNITAFAVMVTHIHRLPIKVGVYNS